MYANMYSAVYKVCMWIFLVPLGGPCKEPSLQPQPEDHNLFLQHAENVHVLYLASPVGAIAFFQKGSIACANVESDLGSLIHIAGLHGVPDRI